eukprot:19121-Heterococcus_DN1.PRE.2
MDAVEEYRSMAELVLATLGQALIAAINAAEGAEANTQSCKRLAERVKLLQPCLQDRARDMPHYAEHVKKFCKDVQKTVQEYSQKRAITKFAQHLQSSKKFDALNKDLDRLRDDVIAVTADAAKQRLLEDQQDKQEDFDLVQQINKELLKSSEADRVNEKLQLDATLEYTGFVEIKFSASRLGAFLGKGAVGDVYRTTHRSIRGERPAAIKVIRGNTANADVSRALRKELRVLTSQKAKHPNTIELYGACTGQFFIYISTIALKLQSQQAVQNAAVLHVDACLVKLDLLSTNTVPF